MSRLARIRCAALAAAIVLGCKLTSTGPATGLILGIEIAPSRFTLLSNQAANLTVAVFSSKTDSTAVALAQGTLQWSTTGGTVSNNGLLGGVRHMTYSAPPLPGTYFLVVTTVNGWPSDTASFNVTTTPVPVAQIQITPSSKNLVVGDTLTLQVTTLDSDGRVIVGRPITWTTSDAGVATVLSTGFVRAMTPGTVTITASTPDQSGTATITVTQ